MRCHKLTRYFNAGVYEDCYFERRAFTLVELLVVIAIIALLMGILMPALTGSRRRAQAVACSSHMRQMAMASQMYVSDFDGFFAKTSHSAALNRCLRWGPAFSKYLGYGRYKDPNSPSWKNLFNKFYHCPSDKRNDLNKWSYGKNVWFELSSLETAYAAGESSGGPTYQTLMQVRHPAATVEFGELLEASMADHFMAHFWAIDPSADTPPEVDAKRHGRMANYSYVDGHILAQNFMETFDISDSVKRVDNWNSGKAR